MIVDAALWLQHLMLGTGAVAVATLAVAGVGFAALTGRVDLRHGSTVLLGCFILFGAPMIAAGLRAALDSVERSPVVEVETLPPAALLPPLAPPSRVYDPYGGAAVPQQR